jgi:hypothetical protein
VLTYPECLTPTDAERLSHTSGRCEGVPQYISIRIYQHIFPNILVHLLSVMAVDSRWGHKLVSRSSYISRDPADSAQRQGADRGHPPLHAPPHAPPQASVPTHASATHTCPMWQKVLKEMERDGIALQVLHAELKDTSSLRPSSLRPHTLGAPGGLGSSLQPGGLGSRRL